KKMTATPSMEKDGTRDMPREHGHMRPVTWNSSGRLPASLGVLPLSTLLTRRRKMMRVISRSLERHVSTSSLTGDKPEAIGAKGKGSNADINAHFDLTKNGRITHRIASAEIFLSMIPLLSLMNEDVPHDHSRFRS